MQQRFNGDWHDARKPYSICRTDVSERSAHLEETVQADRHVSCQRLIHAVWVEVCRSRVQDCRKKGVKGHKRQDGHMKHPVT